jgi:hypothetical protein
MFDTTQIPTTLQPVEAKQADFLRASLPYCLAFVAVQLILLISSVWIASRPWFLKHDDIPRIAVETGYSLHARGLNCDVVIYGDSTALVGLDPSVIQAGTGLKTCNISEMQPVQRSVGSYFPLDEYLAHNKAPRFLLTMWNPIAFHPTITPMQGYSPEGVVYALQFHPGFYLARAFFMHPTWAANFSTLVIRSIIWDTDERLLTHLHLSHKRVSKVEAVPRDTQAGLWEIDQPVQTKCVADVPDPLTQAEKESSVAAFRKRYSTSKTTVLMNIGPLADCVENISQLARSNAGLYDNRFEALPYNEFNMTNVHVVHSGRQHISKEAVDQILGLMRNETSRKLQSQTTVVGLKSR